MKHKMALGNCPLCENPYEGNIHQRTSHHIFPKYWYGKIGVTCLACHECHNVEFHNSYPMNIYGDMWTKRQCLKYWVDFCRSKGKNAFRIYPQLKRYKRWLSK